jgi:hypothetical protein
MDVDINNFHQETECIYKGERYSVRDNGAVLRHPREGKRPRPTDNTWTFGKPNEKTGYMEIASKRVHRIAAFAFLGEPPTPEHIVDHKDTNRRNNRVENLRWVTKLENALNNPITRKRIILRCGSIESFLANPSQLNENDTDPNFQWMRSVTPEEAKISKERLLSWAESDKVPSGKGFLGEWIYKPFEIYEDKYENTDALIESKTNGAVQRDWRTPSEFPCCPQEIGADPVAAYTVRLKEGALFVRNDIYESMVLKFAVSKDGKSIFVMTENAQEGAIKPWALAEITYEDRLYIHTSHGSFFTPEGVEKQFTILQGLEWTGGDSIDDYC